MTGIAVVAEAIRTATNVGALMLLAVLTAPLWFRLVNEVTCRTVRRAVVICPHCGVPGVVKSEKPYVLR